MTCSCIETIEAEQLLGEHRIDIAICLTKTGLVARAYSRLLRRDTGKPETRRGKHSSIVATFCPFCGERYEPAPAEPASADA